jgi:hypothetical protein
MPIEPNGTASSSSPSAGVPQAEDAPLSIFEELHDGRLNRLAFEVIFGALRVRLAANDRRAHLHRGVIYVKNDAGSPGAEPSEGRVLEVLSELSDPRAALRSLRLAVSRVVRPKYGQPPAVAPVEIAAERSWDECYAGPDFCKSPRWCSYLEDELESRRLTSTYGQQLGRLTCPAYVHLSSAEEVGEFWASLAHAPSRLRVVAALEAVAEGLERQVGATGGPPQASSDAAPDQSQS